MLYQLAILWSAWTLLAATPTVPPLKVRTYNATDTDVYIWINDQFVGQLAGKSSAEMTVAIVPGADPVAPQRVAVIAVSEHEKIYKLNAADIRVARDADVALVWGAAMVPTDLAATGVKVQLSPKMEAVFQARRNTLRGHQPGRPFKMAETLIGSTQQEHIVKGEMLSVRSGDLWHIHNHIGMLLVRIPGGNGANDTADDRPQTIANGDFFMAVTETTNGQLAVAGARTPQPGQEDMPASMVTWQEAVDFCLNLASDNGWAYRLPTEAQWQYACMAGGPSRFSPSGKPLHHIMWFNENAGRQAHRVGELLPNGFGLFDMHGNLREWCRDLWAPERVRRGGSFDSPSGWCGCGYRDSGPAALAVPWTGFRVVLERLPVPNTPLEVPTKKHIEP